MENFILYEELSREESCILYKGRKKNTINFLAIKCAEKCKKGEIANMVRLIHEIKHDNIVKFYEWYETAGHLWLMLELCIGGSLELLLKMDGSLPEDSIREFGIGLAKGLYHIHSLDILYSDLQPSKVFVSGSGCLKLGDFGLSRVVNENLDVIISSLFSPDEIEEKPNKEGSCSFLGLPENLKSAGNPKYMAPEVTAGGSHSFQSDLWSFGCIMYEMFSGFPPFNAENFSLLKDQILNDEIPPPKSPHGDPSNHFLDLVVHGLLSKRPQSRITWSEVLSHPFWGGALNHLKVSDAFVQPGMSSISSQDAVKQSIHRSISNFKVYKEFGEGGAAEGQGEEEDGSGAESDETIAEENHTLRETNGALSLKKWTEDDVNEVCQYDLCADDDSMPKQTHYRDVEVENSDEIHSEASEATCMSSDLEDLAGLVFHQSDFQLSPIVNTGKGSLKVSNLKFDLKALGMTPVDVKAASKSEIEEHLKVVTNTLLSLMSHKGTPAPQKLVQLLNYIGSTSNDDPFVSSHLISLKILSHLAKQSKENGQVEMKLKLCQVFDVIVSNATKLHSEADLSEAFSYLVDGAREHLTNQRLKTSYLVAIGDLLTLIAKQDQMKKETSMAWMVPPTVYSFINKCLTEGEDLMSNLYAARIIANVSSYSGNHNQRFLSIDICNNLWSMYLHGATEFIKIAAITALSRLSRHSLSPALNLFEKHGTLQYLHTTLSTTNNKLQQPGVTLLVLILNSNSRPSSWLLDKEPLGFLLKLLESSTTVVRAKAYLGIVEIVTSSHDQLLQVCQNRFLMTIEKDLKKTSSNVTSKTGDYLQDCLKVVICQLVGVIPAVFNDILASFEVAQGRKHLPPQQQKQLKYSLSLLQIIQHFINSSVFRPKIISKSFLRNLSKLYEFLVVTHSSAIRLPALIGVPSYDEFIQTTFGCSEFIVLHCEIIDDHIDIIINNILSCLSSLVTCSSGDLRCMSLRFFCESCIMLLSNDKVLAKPQSKCLERLLDGFISYMGGIIVESENCSSHALRLILEVLIRKPHFCRCLEETNLMGALFQVVHSYNGNIVCNIVEQILSILKCYISTKETNMKHLFQMGFPHFLNFVFTESNLFHPRLNMELDFDVDDSPSSGQRDQLLLEVLDTFHVLMKRVSEVVRGALEAKKLGNKMSSDTAEAKELLALNKIFVAFMTPLSHLLCHGDEEISEEALKCLGFLIQFYGGENEDSLSVENQACFREYLKRCDVKKQKIILRLIKRLITTSDANASVMLQTNTPLLVAIQNMAETDRSCPDDGTCSIAKDIMVALRKPSGQ